MTNSRRKKYHITLLCLYVPSQSAKSKNSHDPTAYAQLINCWWVYKVSSCYLYQKMWVKKYYLGRQLILHDGFLKKRDAFDFSILPVSQCDK